MDAVQRVGIGARRRKILTEEVVGFSFADALRDGSVVGGIDRHRSACRAAATLCAITNYGEVACCTHHDGGIGATCVPLVALCAVGREYNLIALAGGGVATDSDVGQRIYGDVGAGGGGAALRVGGSYGVVTLRIDHEGAAACAAIPLIGGATVGIQHRALALAEGGGTVDAHHRDLAHREGERDDTVAAVSAVQRVGIGAARSKVLAKEIVGFALTHAVGNRCVVGGINGDRCGGCIGTTLCAVASYGEIACRTHRDGGIGAASIPLVALCTVGRECGGAALTGGCVSANGNIGQRIDRNGRISAAGAAHGIGNSY